LLPGDEFYFAAFWELSSERQVGQVFGPIPWSRVVDYAFFAGLNASMLSLFLRVIRAMDDGYLGWLREQHDRATRMAKASQKSKATTVKGGRRNH